MKHFVSRTRKIIYCLIAGLCFYVFAASAQIGSVTNIGPTVNNLDAIAFNSSGALYGATSGAGSLYTINPATGATTLVHALVGISNANLTYGLSGLAFQPGTGTLYGSTSLDSPNSGASLVTINPATGQVTVIGPTGTGRAYTDISFAPNGTLYGWLIGSGGTTISAATINLATGAGTSLGSPQTPAALPDGGGLAVNSNGVIYVAANGHVGGVCSPSQTCSGAFWTINPATGVPTTIGTLSGGPGVAPTFTALAFSPGGVLYTIEGGDGGAAWNLLTISLSQGGPNAPAITAVENAASNIAPGLPNAAIAEGSIFIVQGSNLGPANISIAPAAFQSASLSGTSVTVTVGGLTVNAPMYYTSAAQVAALLPSNTPPGTGTITVTYNNITSATAPITVVANNLGIFTIDSTGQGPGIVTYPDYSLVSAVKAANCGGPNTTCGAANPGDTLILWATGLGPVSGSDASGTGLGQNMPNLPLKLWIGGVQANVIYQGRSGCCIGEDQIVFTVPSNAPTGCAIPLLVEITTNSTLVSNNTIIPIAKGSRTCSLGGALASVNVAQITGTVPFGQFELDHFLNNAGTGFQDFVQVAFATFTVPAALQPFAGSYLDNLPVGACIAQSGPHLSNPVFTNIVQLDAGSSFTIKGPNGSMTVSAKLGDTVTLSAAGTFLAPGDYTVTGTGGKDIGPFTSNVSIPVSPVITSPASANKLTVSRSNGMTVTWNGNGSTGHVEIQVSSSVDAKTGAQVTCSAPASAGTFTIPYYMLSSLPNGSGTGFRFEPGDGPAGPAILAPFTATGLIVGFTETFSDGAAFGGFTITN